MLDLNEIQAALKDRKLSVVSEKSGVGYITVWRISKGIAGNVSYDSVSKISQYIENTR